jgi:hypothetical protein
LAFTPDPEYFDFFIYSNIYLPIDPTYGEVVLKNVFEGDNNYAKIELVDCHQKIVDYFGEYRKFMSEYQYCIKKPSYLLYGAIGIDDDQLSYLNFIVRTCGTDLD